MRPNHKALVVFYLPADVTSVWLCAGGTDYNETTLKAFANFSPGLRFGNPGKAHRNFYDATLKELRLAFAILSQLLQSWKNFLDPFEPRVSKPTLG